MKKIITALANPMLNNELKKQKDFIIIGNDITITYRYVIQVSSLALHGGNHLTSQVQTV